MNNLETAIRESLTIVRSYDSLNRVARARLRPRHELKLVAWAGAFGFAITNLEELQAIDWRVYVADQPSTSAIGSAEDTIVRRLTYKVQRNGSSILTYSTIVGPLAR